MTMKSMRGAFAAIAVAAVSSLPLVANAALVGGTANWIQSLRVESGNVYIALNYPIGGTCSNRVYFDPTTPIGKANYAAAMLAFSIPKPIMVRAYDEAPKISGACHLFDIEVSN